MTFGTPRSTGLSRRTGRALSGLVIAYLTMDRVIKLVPIQPVVDTLLALGFRPTPTLARGLSVLLLACTLLYAVPRTAWLGALLLTSYLGGAIAIHLRADSPRSTHEGGRFMTRRADWPRTGSS